MKRKRQLKIFVYPIILFISIFLLPLTFSKFTNTFSNNQINLSITKPVYKVKFNSNGGTGTMSDMNFVYGTSRILTANTYSKQGCTFLGWNTKEDGTGTNYHNNEEVNNLTSINGEEIILYAMWLDMNKLAVSKSFDYTGEVDSFTPTVSGYYYLEAWGAQGGRSGLGSNPGISSSILNIAGLRSDIQQQYNSEGGRGGYSNGYLYLEEGQTIYLAVGGAGETAYNINNTYLKTSARGGFNGGNNCSVPSSVSSDSTPRYFRGSGGGATHFSLSIKGSGLLYEYENSKDDVLIVAGGGGGSSIYAYITHQNWCQYGKGGYGGGTIGGSVTSRGWDLNTNYTAYNAIGATQTSGGSIVDESGSLVLSNVGKFGRACGTSGYPNNTAALTVNQTPTSGGGGGWYGGTNIGSQGGSGGSGHINTSNLINGQMIAGNASMPNHDRSGTMIGNTGNGYAKVSYIKQN